MDKLIKLSNPNEAKIIVPSHISREFIKTHKECNFVYSADYLLKGTFGQMWSAHNEPNTYPVPVLYKACANSVFFQDHEEQRKWIDEFIGRIPRDKPIIIFPKIGEGHSRMREFSPQLFSYLHQKLELIETTLKHIDYYA